MTLSVFFITGCSTKKKTWAHRTYHNTTAKYNGYFNGKQSLNTGIKKIHLNHKNDYTQVLSVFPTGNLKKGKKAHSNMDKAIKKGSVVIQRHSIKIKGKEYCKWIDDSYLMVGKGYFYKGEFDEAIKAFSFVKSEYEAKKSSFEASLWLVRSYGEKNDFSSAKIELNEILKNKEFPDKLEKKIALVAADFYIKTKNYPSAIVELKNITSKIKTKRKKVRLNYILAQIHQQLDNFKLAQKYYEKVLKSSPEYDMLFNAKMNLARSIKEDGVENKKMKERLVKMINDEKNKEYLDQIYFTLAEMDINNKDTVSAINNYKLAALNSVENNSQKALAFLALGKIDFKKGIYRSAKNNYDSTITYMDEDFRIYQEVKTKHSVLTELIKNTDIIETEDSLQLLARLPKKEQEEVVNQIIQDKIKKEQLALQEERLKQQMRQNSNINNNRTDQFGNKTSGGKWYFYNPSTLSFGLSEFRKKWGKRKLEDDWRRKNKKTKINFTTDTINTDSLEIKTKKNNITDYLDQLPQTKEDFIYSDKKIKEALYQVGVISREELKNTKMSNRNFEAIFNRFPSDTKYAPLALYNIYINALEKKQVKKQEEIKIKLAKNYPNSIYTKALTDAGYLDKIGAQENTLETRYQDVFLMYKNRLFNKVLEKTDNIDNDKYKNKYLLIRALSLVKVFKTKEARLILQNLSQKEDSISKKATYLLDAINNPEKMEKANELAFLGSQYLYRTNHQQMVVLLIPKSVDVTYLKTIISDFHRDKISNEIFEISALLLGVDQHLLMIKSFPNTKEAMKYYNLILKEEEVTTILSKTEYKLMTISFDNFQEFYKNKDVDGYYDFFKKNYLEGN